MTKEWFTMWFEDGGGRTLLHGRLELKEFSKSHDFDYDEVINFGETFIKDEDGDTIGGVYREGAA